MQGSREPKKQNLKPKGCMKAFCCSSRLSVSSSHDGPNLDRSTTISSVAHTMVQEKLDHMIKERREARHAERRKSRGDETKFVVIVATEKSSYDPREDFRESVVEMITANRIHEPKDLKRLLNYYISMNKEEYRGVILEVFHEVCTCMFLNCKYYS
ncbi:Transcription repressor [Heracleum sosnowskyi]|uniref:Transcription repressor n=1 Tax=Heracleum sosnowskyi TaxID=360622 RepID=A0AAD8MNI8_9APIA|nr:Transcription repressor [Heracleum sosnowskyi]